ncbi:MAG: ammonium transporter [Dehalococcoidia bacterium]
MVGAQEVEESIADLATAIDTAWLLIAATLVMLMQAGFGLVESGFVRSKNVVNILMKNSLDVLLGSLIYFAFGWALAYGVSGDGAGGFFGNGNFFLTNFTDYPSWFFQFAFAATAATIVSGAMAERTKFGAYLIYTVAITGVVYPIVTHWVWDGAGWLTAFTDDPIGDNGFVDFAGSTVVHSVGGWAALVGAIMVGPRIGKYAADGSVRPIPGHSMPLGFLGVLILWIGWYGFNPGSTLGLSGGFAAIAARVAVTTTLAAGAGGVAAMGISWMKAGKSDFSLTLNGVLGGLVGITAGCATVEPWAAIVIGLVAGVIIVFGVDLLDSLHIDDPVGAVPVHLMNGVWGTLAVGLFTTQGFMADAYGVETSSYGLLVGGGANMLIIQALGVIAVGAWTLVTAGLIFTVIKMTVGLRVSAAEEESGLDVGEHGMEAYPEFTGGRDPFGIHGGLALSGSGAAAPMPGSQPMTQTRPASEQS